MDGALFCDFPRKISSLSLFDGPAMLSRLITFLILTVAAGLLAPARADGTLLAYGCAGCHGTNGISQGPATPNLAGMESQYFIETMSAFRNGRRASTIMDRIAKGYSEEEVKVMAAFFAAQPLQSPPRTHDAAGAKIGAELHRRFCDKCHGNNGRDAEDSAPLAGQPRLYLEWSLQDFVNGARPIPRKMQRELEKIYVRHGDEGLAALADFYAGQGPQP